MALSLLLSGSPKGHALIKGHIISDNGRLTNNHTIAMIDKKSSANLRTGMNLDSRLSYAPLGNPSCQKIMLFQIQLMG